MTSAFLTLLLDWLSRRVELLIWLESDHLVVGFRQKRMAETIGFIEKGKEITMLVLTETQQSTLTLAIKDAKGRLAKVDGIPEWNTSDPLVAKIEDISADGLMATVKSLAPGICQVTVTADADLGDGAKNITGFLAVNVSGGEAVTVELTPGPLTEQ